MPARPSLTRWITIVALALGCRRTPTPTQSTPTTLPVPDGASRAQPSQWQQLLARIPAHADVPLEIALQAWESSVGSLPGVPPAPQDGSAPACSYGAQLWLLHHWDALTPAQRDAVIARANGARSLAQHATLDRALAAAIPGFGEEEGRCSQQQSAPWTEQEKQQTRALLASLTREISARTGRAFRDEIEVRWADRRYLRGPRDGACGEAAAQVFPFRSTNGVVQQFEVSYPIAAFSSCVMEIGKLVIEQPQLARALLGHELVHCFQQDAFDGTVGDWGAMNSRDNASMQYIVEGGAAWLGEELAGGTDFAESWWVVYLNGRRGDGAGRYDLVRAQYDAIGLYAHLAARGAPLWQTLVPAVNRGPQEFFDASVRSVPRETEPLSSWASSTVRREWSAAWRPEGRAIPAHAHRVPDRAEPLRNGSNVPIAAMSMAQYVARFPVASGVRVVRAIGRGHARASFDGAAERSGDGAIQWDWCVDRCQCPDGRPLGGVSPDATPVRAGSELTVALAGNAHESTTLRIVAFDPCVSHNDRDEDAGSTAPAPERPIVGQDPCLLGGWLLDTASSTVFDALRANREIRYRGTLALSFTAREALAAPAGFVAEFTPEAPGVAGAIRATIYAQGATTTAWRANGRRIMFDRAANGLHFSIHTTMGGIPLPIPAMTWGTGSMPEITPSTANYECLPRRRLTFFLPDGTRAVYRKR